MDPEELDHVCWLLVQEISDSVPLRETAEENCENSEELELDGEVNYLAGRVDTATELADMLDSYDVNVLERAKNYGDVELDESDVSDAFSKGWLE